MKFAAMLLVSCLALSAADRIVVIAHRGEHRAHPENTLPAFQAAIDAGADFFELDVRTTSDGRLVLMHDARVDRTTKG
jgi:glycerophosphoryl diester phosphodiesterase